MLSPAIAGFVRISKIPRYESPYNVIGVIKQTGPKEAPKSICTDKVVGTWKAGNTENLHSMKWYGGKFQRHELHLMPVRVVAQYR